MYIIIIGCGKVGSELARLLADAGHNVVIVDKDVNSFQRLGADFNGVTLTGDGFDVDLLKEAGIEQADAFCTVTDNDNANIMSGQVAKKIFHIPKVITRINDIQYTHIYQELGIDVVNSTTLLASVIRNKLLEGRSSSLLLEDSRLDVIEIEVNKKIAGKTVEELNLPGELIITAVIRKKAIGPTHNFPTHSEQSRSKELFITRLKDKVEEGDVVIAVIKTESLNKIRRLLGLNKS